MDEQLKWFASLGVGGTIAGLTFYYYRLDALAHASQWRDLSAERKADNTMLMAVIKENSAAMTANTATIQALHRRDDRIEEILQSLGYDLPHRAPKRAHGT